MCVLKRVTAWVRGGFSSTVQLDVYSTLEKETVQMLRA